MPADPAEILAEVLVAERSGDLLTAYDVATRGLEEHPDDLRLRHRAVLALARSGATSRARAMLRALGLEGHADEDVAALEARLAKDHALAAIGGERQARARHAAALYGAIHARTGGHYPAINAATLHRLAGDLPRAEALAREAVAGCRRAAPGGALDAYWIATTEAEATLLLGDAEAARERLVRARAANPGDHAALATTRRQLGLLCEVLGAAPALLDALKPPSVVHYTGHMIAPPGGAGRFAAASEGAVAEKIAAELETRTVGYGFGALACGADILFAEALLARGAELHVVLPFDAEEFCRVSVARGGEPWLARFASCLAGARTVTFATTDAGGGGDELFAYASRLAMGLALLRARFLCTDVAQIAVWDGKPPSGPAGTGADVELWRSRGHPVVVLSPGPAAGAEEDAPRAPVGAGEHQVVRAMLFGDVKGYSKLLERQVPAFVREVLGAFARVLDGLGDDVEERNTWGDGLYVVLRGVTGAARCALGLQAAMEGVDLAASGLPPHLALRLAGHVGPVFRCFDAVARHASFFGTHVTRTARIEPVTPEGEVFVTEPFAAEIALEDAAASCEYVGRMPAAKGFGWMRMYGLSRRV